MAKALARAAARAGSALEMVAAALLFAVMAMTVIDVVGRYLFSSPLSGATELTEFGIALAVFCALPALTASRGHVSVDLLEKFYPPAFRRWRDRVCYLLFAVGFALVGMRSLEVAQRSLRRGELTEFLSFPLAWVLFALSALVALAALAALVAAFVSAEQKGPAEGVQNKEQTLA